MFEKHGNRTVDPNVYLNTVDKLVKEEILLNFIN